MMSTIFSHCAMIYNVIAITSSIGAVKPVYICSKDMENDFGAIK